MKELEFIIALLSSLSAIIALAVKLWQTLSSLINEKKYAQLFELVSDAIVEAEEISSLSGDEKKSRVMDAVEKAAESLGIEGFDSERISSLIETIIDVTKKVNVKN